VVADEVRTLAQRAGEASSSISSLVERIERGTASSESIIAQMAEESQQANETADETLTAVSEALDVSKRAFSTIDASVISFFSEVALLQSLHIHSQLCAYLAGASAHPPMVVDARDSYWGQWYYSMSDGDEVLTAFPQIHELTTVYNQTFEAARSAIVDIESGRKEHAEAAIQTMNTSLKQWHRETSKICRTISQSMP
jgi:hypothetical protein